MTPSLGDVATATLARVRYLEAELQGEPFLSDTEYLLLPLWKQEMVLRRLSAFRAYDAIEKPTAKDAARLATASGLGLTRFYQLLAHWRQRERSPLSLIPSPATERRTRLPAEETAAAIRREIRKVIAAEPLASTGAVIKDLRKSWSGPGDLPTDAALRIFHDRVLKSVIRAPGSLIFPADGFSRRPVTAEGFGQTLVIDHVLIADMVEEASGTTPSVTLAIDLWTGNALGGIALLGPPRPEGALLALRDAARRIDRRRDEIGSQEVSTSQRIVLAATASAEWRALRDGLRDAGFEVVDREDETLRVGDAARLLLGFQLGQLRLERRPGRTSTAGHDLRNSVVQPLATINRILGEMIDATADERVPAAAWGTAIPFKVPAIVGISMTDVATIEPSGAGGGQAQDPRLPEGIGWLLFWMVERITGSSDGIDVHRSSDGVWHVTATAADPSSRDELFGRLARSAMEITALHRVPVIVDVMLRTEG